MICYDHCNSQGKICQTLRRSTGKNLLRQDFGKPPSSILTSAFDLQDYSVSFYKILTQVLGIMYQ